ncbi:MAG TPA: TolC family protein [Burkholderiales bacterium]|nr:TolC family protein [Burkholderiales bacterium]
MNLFVMLRRAALLSAVGVAWLQLAQAWSAEPLTFERALELAERQAPALAARHAAVESAHSAAQAAGRLPDPKLALGVENLPISGEERFTLTRDFMTMRKIGVMQEVPNAGRRRAQLDAANALVARERAAETAERLAVRREAASAWINRYYAERQLALFEALEAENKVLQDTVKARVAAGRALPADAAMARQEALGLADRRDELERELAKSKAALHRWIGVSADEPLAGMPRVARLDAEHLRGALERHPELAAYTPMAQMAAAEVREIDAGRRPDWSWELSYGRRGSQFGDMSSVQVSFNVPFFGSTRRNALALAKQHEVARVDAEREDMLRRHRAELEGWLAEQEELERKLARVRDAALPLADERVRLTLASYQSGRAGLDAVLAARRERAETRLREIQAEGALDALRARLTWLTGEEHR